MQAKSIAILGAGNVGAALARVWAACGHTIAFGVPDPKSETVKLALAALGGKGRADNNKEAVFSSEIVALCVPWNHAEEAIRTSGSLTGKVLVDCTNPLSTDVQRLVVGSTTSAAEQVASWASGARVVKAFNTIGAVNFGNAQFGAQRADGFYCGDDDAAKSIVRDLIACAGLDPRCNMHRLNGGNR